MAQQLPQIQHSVRTGNISLIGNVPCQYTLSSKALFALAETQAEQSDINVEGDYIPQAGQIQEEEVHVSNPETTSNGKETAMGTIGDQEMISGTIGTQGRSISIFESSQMINSPTGRGSTLQLAT